MKQKRNILMTGLVSLLFIGGVVIAQSTKNANKLQRIVVAVNGLQNPYATESVRIDFS